MALAEALQNNSILQTLNLSGLRLPSLFQLASRRNVSVGDFFAHRRPAFFTSAKIFRKQGEQFLAKIAPWTNVPKSDLCE